MLSLVRNNAMHKARRVVAQGCVETMTVPLTGTVGGMPFTYFKRITEINPSYSKIPHLQARVTRTRAGSSSDTSFKCSKVFGLTPSGFQKACFSVVLDPALRTNLPAKPPENPTRFLTIKFPENESDWKDVFEGISKGAHMRIEGHNLENTFPIEALEIAILSGNLSSLTFTTSREMTRSFAIRILNAISRPDHLGKSSSCISISKSTSSFPFRSTPTTIITEPSRSDDYLSFLKDFNTLEEEQRKLGSDLTVTISHPYFDDTLFLLLTEELMNPSSTGDISFSFSNADHRSKATFTLEVHKDADPTLKLSND